VTGADPFVFGKLPSHGDFVCRGLTPADRETWDAWASAGLEAASAALGSGFEEAHNVAPPWRFVLPAGEGWCAGAFCPSMDRAGRRFVIVAGLRVLGAPTLNLEAATEAVEEAVYAAFTAGQDADGLFARLQAIPQSTAAGPPAARAWTLGGERHAPAVTETTVLEPGLLLAALAPSITGALA
jgi:type VI secretion system ImpM family protein